MTVITARQLAPGQQIEADICIVGSGPAGLTVAAALVRAGYSVCVIESGYAAPHQDTQELSALESVGHPVREPFVHRLRMLGGNANLWAGRCMPLEQIDFETRDWVPASGWPVSFAEYLGFLRQAARLMRLPEPFVEHVAAKAGEPAPDVPFAHFARADFSPKLALWAKRPPDFWNLFGNTLKTCPACRIIIGLTVTGLRLNESGTRVTALRAVQSTGGPAHALRARRFILAMGGIENTRLLLLGLLDNPQACYPREPLGRYFMDHPRALYGQIRLSAGVDLTGYLGCPVSGGMMQPGLGLAFDKQRALRCMNGYLHFEVARPPVVEQGYDTTLQVMKCLLRRGYAGRRLAPSLRPRIHDLIYHLTPRELLPYALYRFYFRARALVGVQRRNLVVYNHCEQVPDPDSRITLGTGKDRFGNPLARLNWRLHPPEIETLVRLQETLRTVLETRGLGRLLSDPNDLEPALFADASHHLGGTRMSARPATGVVDADLKVHGVVNLFICGGSVFPTSGSGNPTWSIVAFALRLAEHLGAPGGSAAGRGAG
jgi:choline dehydrogenase-like flavoprotein